MMLLSSGGVTPEAVTSPRKGMVILPSGRIMWEPLNSGLP